MKIAFITTTMFSYGNGPANFAVNLLRLRDQFIKRGFSFIFLTEEPPEKPETAVENVALGLSSRLGPLSMLGRPYDYYKALKARDYDARIWNFSLVAAFTLWKKSKSSPIKDVVFVNDPFSVDLKKNGSIKTALRYKTFRQFERYSCRKANLVVANSEVLKELLVNEYEIAPDKITVLFKGINFSEIKVVKTDYTIDKEAPIKVCFVKSNHIAGGLQLLCDALALLNYQFILTVIGPNAIEPFFHEYDNIQIHLKGRQPKSVVYEQMSSSDFFAVPFLLEAFGQVNMEAFKVGVPTVILPTNYQMLLHDKSYAHIPETVDKEDIAHSISALINKKTDDRESMSAKGKEIVSLTYGIQTMSDQLIKILGEL